MSEYETVLLPGLYGGGELFEPLLDAAPLDIEVSVITYPLEGHLGFEDLVVTAENQIPKDKPVQIVAESFSGLVAIRLLTRNERDYKRVVFCAAFASPPYPYLARLVKVLPAWMYSRLTSTNILTRYFCLNGVDSRSIVEPVSRVIARLPLPIIKARLAMIVSLNLVSELQHIDIPSVYLRSSEDRLVPRRCVNEFAENVHSIIVRKMKGPHFLLQTSPGVAAGVIFGKNIVI